MYEQNEDEEGEISPNLSSEEFMELAKNGKELNISDSNKNSGLIYSIEKSKYKEPKKMNERLDNNQTIEKEEKIDYSSNLISENKENIYVEKNKNEITNLNNEHSDKIIPQINKNKNETIDTYSHNNYNSKNDDLKKDEKEIDENSENNIPSLNFSYYENQNKDLQKYNEYNKKKYKNKKYLII